MSVNVFPRSGWKGWVIRRERVSSTGSRAVDCLLERVRGEICPIDKEECLNRMIFVSHASLRHAVGQYLSHYHRERNHQGLGNQLLIPSRVMGEPGVPVKRRERLGGMLSYYHREAA